MSELGQKTVPPVFLFGFERSGTTILSMMLGAHPRVAVPFSVTGTWYRYGRMLDRYGGLRSVDDVQRIVSDLLAEKRIKLWDAQLDRDEILAGLRPGRYSDVIARFHELYAQRKGKELWGNVDIATLEKMDVANGWFPDCKFVHIIRDGRDVALSHETYAYGASNAVECAEAWCNQLRVNMKMGAILGPSRYFILKYEDLILDSEAALGRLCHFIGIDYSEEMLSYPQMVHDKIPESRRWLWPSISSPPLKENAYRWKERMGRTKRIAFENVANSLLKDLRYEAYPVVPKAPVAYLYELYCFLGKGHRFRRLKRKIGLRKRAV